MLAHRIRIIIPESHEVTVQLPSELPSGEAEIIVLAGEPRETRALTFEERFPPDPVLARVVFHEDPTAPISVADWPPEQRP